MTPWQFWTFVFDTSHFGTLFLTRRILELHRWHSRFLQMFCHTVWFRDIAFDTHVSWELAPDTRHPWHDVWRQYDFEDRKLPSLFINFHYLTRPRLEVCLWHVIKWKQPLYKISLRKCRFLYRSRRILLRRRLQFRMNGITSDIWEI